MRVGVYGWELVVARPAVALALTAPIDLRVSPRAMEVPRGNVKVVRAAVVKVRVSVKVRVRVRVRVRVGVGVGARARVRVR